MPKLYIGEQLTRIMERTKVASDLQVKAPVNPVYDIFLKVAAKLGVEVDANLEVEFGDSFVKYAELNSSDFVCKVADAMGDIDEAIKTGNISSIDENLRNLFSNIDDDKDLASSINIRGLLADIQGPEA